LPYLHEPAILFCLEKRYSQGDIYTYTGPILIAMNPFKRLPLYSNQILEIYYNNGLLKSQGIESMSVLPPHVYAIADSAYRLMMQSIISGHSSSAVAAASSSSLRGAIVPSSNHSILISGESGAGKTESTKIVLRYLTTVGSPSGTIETETGSVMDKILQSNPILEAFGNARTLRNDNSSRFGKFIELSFNKRGHLIGGIIRTYLLEKVRLPSQQRGERNFHIFYQLFSGCTKEQYQQWKLNSIEQYEYLLQGGIYKLQSIDDKYEFSQLIHALNILNFKISDQICLFDLVASLLHLGQIEFIAIHDGEGEGSMVSNDEKIQESLQIICELCGLKKHDLIRTLTVRNIIAREETYEKKLTVLQASDARDALAKAIYGRIFDWIVYTINLSIEINNKLVRSTIGVLDIFGFECFQNNSFEQLCINYTNETLQQQFNQYIFKMEQIEYHKEKIQWSFIEFPDNQDCLDLIENKISGIFAMIDDECRLPNSSDIKLAGRMYKAYDKNLRFNASITQKRDNLFCINHYAGSVVYSTTTFVEKNKDELPKEATTLLQLSTQSLLSLLFSPFSFDQSSAIANANNSNGSNGSSIISSGKVDLPTDQSSSSRGSVTRGRISTMNIKNTNSNNNNSSGSNTTSVGSQFKEQLHTLMSSIYATTPHYIRCLKPNDYNVPDNFGRLRIAEQLRYGGVLEAVRVARSGFPVRLSHIDFYSRYRLIANPFSTYSKDLPTFCHKDKITNEKLKSYCDMLLIALWDDTLQTSNDYDTPKKSPLSPSSVTSSSSKTPQSSSSSSILIVDKDKSSSSSSSNKSPTKVIENTVHRRKSCTADISIWKSKVAIVKESLQLGLTKVFLRKQAHDVLESRRSRRIHSAARHIQSLFRCKKTRAWYLSLILSTRLIQRVCRGMFCRKKVHQLRSLKSSIIIQKYYRMYIIKKKYRLFLRTIVTLQGKYHIWKAKILSSKLNLLKKVMRLQRIIRGIIVRYHYKCYRSAIITLQLCYRKYQAKNKLKILKVAAKDVGKLKQNNENLKFEIEKLKQKAIEDRERIRKEMEKTLILKANEAKDNEIKLLQEELKIAYINIEKEKEQNEILLKKLIIAEQNYKNTRNELLVTVEQLKQNQRMANQSQITTSAAGGTSRKSIPSAASISTSNLNTYNNSHSFDHINHHHHHHQIPIAGAIIGRNESSDSNNSSTHNNNNNINASNHSTSTTTSTSTAVVAPSLPPPPTRRRSSKEQIQKDLPQKRHSLLKEQPHIHIEQQKKEYLQYQNPQSHSNQLSHQNNHSTQALLGNNSNNTYTNSNSITNNYDTDTVMINDDVIIITLKDALDKERVAREILEEEISRLRFISMDYKAQIDLLKQQQQQQHLNAVTMKSSNNNSNNNYNHDNDGDDDNDSRKDHIDNDNIHTTPTVLISTNQPNSAIVNSALTQASTSAISMKSRTPLGGGGVNSLLINKRKPVSQSSSSSSEIPLPSVGNNYHNNTNNNTNNDNNDDDNNNNSSNSSVDTPIVSSNGSYDSHAAWSKKWDDNDDDDSSDLTGNDFKSVVSEYSLPSSTVVTPILKKSTVKTNDLSGIQTKNPLRRTSLNATENVSAISSMDMIAAMNTFEKNLNLFQTKLRQV